MSYIRSGSNDEHLYIFCNMSDVVEFHKGGEFVGTMPANVFNKLIDMWIENSQEDTDHEGAVVSEVWVDGEPFTLLHYDHQWDIYMQHVTWYYIARSNYGRSKPFWKTRIRRRLLGFWI